MDFISRENALLAPLARLNYIYIYSPLSGQHGPLLTTIYVIQSGMCIEKCISGEIVDIVVSNVPKKFAILAGYKIVMNQRSVGTRIINPCHSGFALVFRASPSCLGIY